VILRHYFNASDSGRIQSEAAMDDVEYKGYLISPRVMNLQGGGYVATATIVEDIGNTTKTTPFDSATEQTENEAEQGALRRAKQYIDSR
jgi:hypothetical protein